MWDVSGRPGRTGRRATARIAGAPSRKTGRGSTRRAVGGARDSGLGARRAVAPIAWTTSTASIPATTKRRPARAPPDVTSVAQPTTPTGTKGTAKRLSVADVARDATQPSHTTSRPSPATDDVPVSRRTAARSRAAAPTTATAVTTRAKTALTPGAGVRYGVDSGQCSAAATFCTERTDASGRCDRKNSASSPLDSGGVPPVARAIGGLQKNSWGSALRPATTVSYRTT